MHINENSNHQTPRIWTCPTLLTQPKKMEGIPRRRWLRRRQGMWQRPKEKHQEQLQRCGHGGQQGKRQGGSKRTVLWIWRGSANPALLGQCEELHQLPCKLQVAMTHLLFLVFLPSSPAPASTSRTSSLGLCLYCCIVWLVCNTAMTMSCMFSRSAEMVGWLELATFLLQLQLGNVINYKIQPLDYI